MPIHLGSLALTPLDELTGLGETRDVDRPKDLGNLGDVVRRTEVLCKLGGDLLVPHAGRDGDGDGRADGRPQVQHRHGDAHVLVRDRGLHGDVRRRDGDGAADADEDLRRDEHAVGGLLGRVVREADPAACQPWSSPRSVSHSHAAHGETADLQDLVPVGDAHDDAREDRQAAHGDGDGIAKVAVLLVGPVDDDPHPREEVGVDKVAREKVEEVDGEACELAVSPCRGVRRSSRADTHKGPVEHAPRHDRVLGVESVPHAPGDEQNSPNNQHGDERGCDQSRPILCARGRDARFVYPPTAVVLSVMGVKSSANEKPMSKKPNRLNREM